MLEKSFGERDILRINKFICTLSPTVRGSTDVDEVIMFSTTGRGSS